jgi:hypothetical protein
MKLCQPTQQAINRLQLKGFFFNELRFRYCFSYS